MKFGETFAQRSVPEWAAFNLSYNGIKDVIKRYTSSNHGGPVNIPQQGKSRWEDADAALFQIFKDQYDNISLFLGMKQGEIDRRLNLLRKQIASLRTHLDNTLDIDVAASTRSRRYRKLSKETEELGDLIQKAARFASAQKIAFRKLLKKYTKWTGSTSLQTRMDLELFSSHQLQTDYSDNLQELADLRSILARELAVPTLKRHQLERLDQKQQQTERPTTNTRSLIADINQSTTQAPSAFDAAITTVPFGEAAGSAVYWIHPDNLDEARALLHRNMKRIGAVSSVPSRIHSQESLTSSRSVSVSLPDHAPTEVVLFDNAQRFVTDKNSARPSKVALSAYWTSDKIAAVTLAGLSPIASGEQTILLDRASLPVALDREQCRSSYPKEADIVKSYLSEHRDVKPLASVRAYRSRYSGINNTADVANWATLDTSLNVGEVDMRLLGELQESSQTREDFPHAILHIRWEFARLPAVVRAFDESHLAYRVHDFTVEDMAVRTVQKDLPRPSWQDFLQTDITKLPLPHAPNINRLKTTNRLKVTSGDISGTSSGPSSSEGCTASIFSTATYVQSSVTSEEAPVVAAKPPEDLNTTSSTKARKKRARIMVPTPEPRFRYWNEFDDGESDVNPQDSYAIYVDPNEPSFPMFSKAWTAIMSSWPLRLITPQLETANERTPLLYDEDVSSESSSDSGSFVEAQQKQLRRGVVWGLVGGISITFLIGIAVLAIMASVA
ncbi:hypothetical protein H2200_008037 [Cladophialophora chaetospira]|uniref:SPX domain-containing protein n=1 Tax=Cladophialophora chaetospira TaxID=386627 RepID=A0AA38X7E4_9EURO|nr:hypothetical protein H2200_008037 [Cladophialophora chaetospira]